MNEYSKEHPGLPPAISVENISKQYRIGTLEKRHDTLLQSALAWMRSPLANYRSLHRLSHFDAEDSPDIIWALRDVSFQIYPGEVAGIVGRNGAGKSTLLKVLSRITPPTSGRVVLNGRVSSLLEVGTGFHPELTGRENVYLNGTILGMSKAEVDRKFDEIVAFSEIEKFIDTPVKRYSSGMRVRLAFAVSAHLESEILLVDEVLAVGDAAFQQKCLDTMTGVADSGRTVLFVSHNMQAVQRLCTSALLIDGGRMAAQGNTAEIIRLYLQESFTEPLDEPLVLGDTICLRHIEVLQGDYRVGEYVDNSRALEIRIKYDLLKAVNNLHLGFDVFSRDGAHLYRTYDMDAIEPLRPEGSYESVYYLPAGALRTGFYYFELVVGVHRHGFLSRGKIRIKLNFDSARDTDVDLPGVVGELGQWTVLEQEDLPGEDSLIQGTLANGKAGY